MDTEDKTVVRLLEKCDPTKQESLVSENIPDPMDAEQTWPTEEEMQTDDKVTNSSICFQKVFDIIRL